MLFHWYKSAAILCKWQNGFQECLTDYNLRKITKLFITQKNTEARKNIGTDLESLGLKKVLILVSIILKTV